MKEKDYILLAEDQSVGLVSEPAEAVAANRVTEKTAGIKYSEGYNGFYTENADEFEKYKSELIAEATNDERGISWNEVRQQIKDRHPWLR